MDIIEVDGKKMKSNIMFSAAQIQTRVQELGEKIAADYPAGTPITVLIILNGALLFAADLVRHLPHPTEIETMRLQSYHGMESTGIVSLVGTEPVHLKDKHVLVVEDIVDTGRSIKKLTEILNKVGCASIRTACLLDKPKSHIENISVNYVGFSIGPNFVIGYGLDLDGLYRNLPYIAELTPA